MCEARATARAPQHRCIRDMCSPFLLPSLRTSSCGCSLVAGCVAADLRLEQTADCVQALVSGVMLEFGGHVAELWWKRTRRSLARTPMCGGSAAVACRRDRATGHTRRPVPLCIAQSAQWRSCAAEGRPCNFFGQRACMCWCGAGRAPHRHSVPNPPSQRRIRITMEDAFWPSAASPARVATDSTESATP
jgi:hypothetical protein